MTTRDRLGMIAIATLALLAAGWMLVVSPARKEAASLATQVSAAEAQLASAQGSVASATQARARYASAYASVVRLGKAVPPDEEVPSLMYQIAQASGQKHVEFQSIVSGSAGSESSSPSSPPVAATPAGFTQMPFTFVFNGSFADLYHLFRSLDASAVRTSSGDLRVSGRLLTLQGVKLEHKTSEGEGHAADGNLTGTITATAYVLPADQGLAGGATPTSPATPAATSASTGASSTGAPVATIGATR
jgi:Tfp pilus assembly protein PilO